MLSPPVDETAKRLDDMKLTGIYYHNFLLPGSSNWDHMMDIIGMNIQRGMPALDPINSEHQKVINMLNRALSGVVLTRQSDFDSFLIKELKKPAKAAKIVIRFETTVHIRAGLRFPVLDLPKTLRGHSNLAEMERIKKWIQSEGALYMTKDPKKRKTHFDTLDRYKKVSVIQTEAGACFRK
ncbi:hypothetical protein BJX63DRAFT_348631 [Aspergillus granulosus]|uniref:Uncharacterized protein n=1 Tax=Aspergillus granulosus TaxID=176169 RepID=A0ABR4H2C8_9EURO